MKRKSSLLLPSPTAVQRFQGPILWPLWSLIRQLPVFNGTKRNRSTGSEGIDEREIYFKRSFPPFPLFLPPVLANYRNIKFFPPINRYCQNTSSTEIRIPVQFPRIVSISTSMCTVTNLRTSISTRVPETNKRDESVAERGYVDGTRPFSGSASGDGAR